jgi:peroxiredoxin
MKVKNIIILLLGLTVLGLSGFFLFAKVQKTQEKKEIYHSIPHFQLPDINGNIITDKDLPKYGNVLFLFFNPDCELCREEMRQIKTHQAAFSQGQIVFFSPLTIENIRYFLQETGFEPAPNMLFLSDEKEILTDAMEVRTSPAVYIYRNRLLIKRFEGIVKIETLIGYLSAE